MMEMGLWRSLKDCCQAQVQNFHFPLQNDHWRRFHSPIYMYRFALLVALKDLCQSSTKGPQRMNNSLTFIVRLAGGIEFLVNKSSHLLSE